ncbi:MAG TPA: hypothetical protein VIH90_05145 [Candidatus Saccharimonadales bacterium]
MKQEQETVDLSSLRPWLLLSALGTATVLGAGLGITESPSFTAAPDPIAEACLPGVGAALPAQDEVGNIVQESQTVQNMHLFVSAYEQDHGLNKGLWQKLTSGLDKVRGNTPIGGAYTKAQNKEVDKLWKQLNTGQEDRSRQYLAIRGISTATNNPSWLGLQSAQDWGSNGVNGYLIESMADTPNGIVRASGLNQVVFEKSPHPIVSNIAFDMPEVSGSS